MRAALLDQLVQALVPLGVLDEYQSRGVFVNWWEGIKYDLKTIIASGWAPTLIPEPVVIDRFFTAEREAIATQEQRIATAEATLAEAVETAQALLEYEPDEDETPTPALLRALLKDAIGDEETDENRPLREAMEALKAAEADLKGQREEHRRLTAELALKVEFKLFGTEDKLEEKSALLTQAEAELAAAGGPPPATKTRRAKGEPKPSEAERSQLRRRGALAKDIATLRETIDHYQALLLEIGGVITTEQARELILQKHHDLIAGCLQRYVQAEERALFAIFENLFAKYSASAEALETARQETLGQLQGFVSKLGY